MIQCDLDPLFKRRLFNDVNYVFIYINLLIIKCTNVEHLCLSNL